MNGYFHVWFGVKGRKPALAGEIGDAVKTLLHKNAVEHGVQLMELSASADHVHLLLKLEGDQTLSNTLMNLKGASARALFDAWPELRLDLQHNSFWQRGYGWRPVPADQARAVAEYIRTQDDRPLRHG